MTKTNSHFYVKKLLECTEIRIDGIRLNSEQHHAFTLAVGNITRRAKTEKFPPLPVWNPAQGRRGRFWRPQDKTRATIEIDGVAVEEHEKRRIVRCVSYVANLVRITGVTSIEGGTIGDIMSVRDMLRGDA